METGKGAYTMERMLMARALAGNVPINGSMELLPFCNMNCDMCYVRLSKQEAERQGRIRTGAEWLALGREMAENGVLFLLLTGGEPLMHPDFKEIYLGLKKMGMILTINTNGTLLDEEWADFFAADKPRRINITVYGADADTYESLCHYRQGYEKMKNAVRLLRQRDVDVKLSTSVTPANAHQLSDMLKIAEEMEVPMGVDTYMMPAVREREQSFCLQSRLGPEEAAAKRVEAMKWEYGDAFPEVARLKLAAVDTCVAGTPEPQPMSCNAGRCSFSVSWQGELHPCVIMTEPGVDVFEAGFQNAWQQVSAGIRSIRLSADCSVCSLRPLCRTCAASALLESGSMDARPEYMCRYAGETLRLLRLEMANSPSAAER